MSIEIPESVLRNHSGDRGYTMFRKPVIDMERDELIAMVNFLLEQQLEHGRELARRDELMAQRRAIAPFQEMKDADRRLRGDSIRRTDRPL